MLHIAKYRHKDSILCWLLALSLFWNNLTVGSLWIAYGTVSDNAAAYYSTSLSNINWVSLTFMIVIAITGLPSIWIIDRFGMKVSLIIMALLNACCASLRCVSSAQFISTELRYPLLITATVFGALSQPLSLFSSTKLAATWFSNPKRIMANTFSAMGNPLGVILGSLLSPLILGNKGSDGIPLLNNIYLIIPLLGLLINGVGVMAAPDMYNAPLLNADISFISQIKYCITNYNYMILNISFGLMLSSFTTYSTLIQQILCPFGYSNYFSGICGALFLGLGFPGTFACGTIIMKSGGALTETVKVFNWFTAFAMVLFSVVATLPNQYAGIVIVICLIGFFGFGCYPAFLELAAEITFPYCTEAVSSGLMLLVSQVVSLISVTVAQQIAVKINHSPTIIQCSVLDVRDYWLPSVVIALIVVCGTTLLLLGMKPTTYNRKMHEEAVIKIPEENTSSFYQCTDNNLHTNSYNSTLSM